MEPEGRVMKDHTIHEERLPAAVACRECQQWGTAVVIVTMHFPNGESYPRPYCSQSCAAAHYPTLVATLPQPVRPVTVKAAVVAANANRATWHPDPMADDVRREWANLCDESKRLNRRD